MSNFLINEFCLNQIIFGNKDLKFWLKHLRIKTEKDFIKFYTSVGANWLNEQLKKGSISKNQCVSFFTKKINSQLSSQKSYNDRIVYRMENNLENNFIKMWNIKTDIINLPYFLSTSKENWNNKTYTIEIITSNKSKGVDLEIFGINNGEKKILFQTNSKFRVLNFDEENYYMKLKEIKYEK